MNKNIKVWVILLALVFLIGYGFYRMVTKPLPGEAVVDLGRDHVTDIAGVNYSSNPPTSGPHFPTWAKSGVYDLLISDGYLIHSLEHGYVVISYDCTKSILNAKWQMLNVYAHDEPTKESTDSGQLLKHMKFKVEGDISWFTPQNPPEIEIPLSESFNSDECKNLVSELSEFTKDYERVIVAPRMDMDNPVVLTAWGRILKLDKVNKDEINAFIKAFHNKGPEQTME